MKLKYFIIIFFVISAVAVYGYFKSVPGIKNQETARPQIEITPKDFNFGEAVYGQVLEYDFKLKNLGQEILEITRVATSCACTSAKAALEKINPGEEISLRVTYDTGAMSGSHGRGRQERIIYVKSNDPANPQTEVMIYANVK